MTQKHLDLSLMLDLSKIYQ